MNVLIVLVTIIGTIHGVKPSLKGLEAIRDEILVSKVRLNDVQRKLNEIPNEKVPLEDAEAIFNDVSNRLSYLDELDIIKDTGSKRKAIRELISQFDSAKQIHTKEFLPKLLKIKKEGHSGVIHNNETKQSLLKLKKELLGALDKNRMKRNLIKTKLLSDNVEFSHNSRKGLIKHLNNVLKNLASLERDLKDEEMKKVVVIAKEEVTKLVEDYKSYDLKETKEEATSATSEVKIIGVQGPGRVIASVDSKEEDQLTKEIQDRELKLSEIKGRLYENWAKRGFKYIPKGFDKTIAQLEELQKEVNVLKHQKQKDIRQKDEHLEKAEEYLRTAIRLISTATQATGRIGSTNLFTVLSKELEALIKESTELTREYAEQKAQLKELKTKLGTLQKKTHHPNPDKQNYMLGVGFLEKALAEIDQYKKKALELKQKEETIRLEKKLATVITEVRNKFDTTSAPEKAITTQQQRPSPHTSAQKRVKKKEIKSHPSNVPKDKRVGHKPIKGHPTNIRPSKAVKGSQTHSKRGNKVSSNKPPQQGETPQKGIASNELHQPQTKQDSPPLAKVLQPHSLPIQGAGHGKPTSLVQSQSIKGHSLGPSECVKASASKQDDTSATLPHKIYKLKMKIRGIQAKVDKEVMSEGRLPETKRIQDAIRKGEKASIKIKELLPKTIQFPHHQQLIRYDIHLIEALKLLKEHLNQLMNKESLLPKPNPPELAKHENTITELEGQKERELQKVHKLEQQYIDRQTRDQPTAPKNANEAIKTIHAINRFLKKVALTTNDTKIRNQVEETLNLVGDVSEDLEHCIHGKNKSVDDLRKDIAVDKAELLSLNRGKELPIFKEEETIMKNPTNALQYITDAIKQKQDRNELVPLELDRTRDILIKTAEALNQLVVPPTELESRHNVTRNGSDIEKDLAEKRQQLQAALADDPHHKAASTQVKLILNGTQQASENLKKAEGNEISSGIKSIEQSAEKLIKKLSEDVSHLTESKVENHVREAKQTETPTTSAIPPGADLKKLLDEAKDKLSNLSREFRTKKSEYCKTASPDHKACNKSQIEIAHAAKKVIDSIKKDISDHPKSTDDPKKEDIIKELQKVVEEVHKTDPVVKAESGMVLPAEKAHKYNEELTKLKQEIKSQHKLVKELSNKLGLPIDDHQQMEKLDRLVNSVKDLYNNKPLASNIAQNLTELAKHTEPVPREHGASSQYLANLDAIHHGYAKAAAKQLLIKAQLMNENPNFHGREITKSIIDEISKSTSPYKDIALKLARSKYEMVNDK